MAAAMAAARPGRWNQAERLADPKPRVDIHSAQPRHPNRLDALAMRWPCGCNAFEGRCRRAVATSPQCWIDLWISMMESMGAGLLWDLL